MPIYMVRRDLPGVTAKDAAAAHPADLEVQEAFGCRALAYWFDEERQTAWTIEEETIIQIKRWAPLESTISILPIICKNSHKQDKRLKAYPRLIL